MSEKKNFLGGNSVVYAKNFGDRLSIREKKDLFFLLHGVHNNVANIVRTICTEKDWRAMVDPRIEISPTELLSGSNSLSEDIVGRIANIFASFYLAKDMRTMTAEEAFAAAKIHEGIMSTVAYDTLLSRIEKSPITVVDLKEVVRIITDFIQREIKRGNNRKDLEVLVGHLREFQNRYEIYHDSREEMFFYTSPKAIYKMLKYYQKDYEKARKIVQKTQDPNADVYAILLSIMDQDELYVYNSDSFREIFTLLDTAKKTDKIDSCQKLLSRIKVSKFRNQLFYDFSAQYPWVFRSAWKVELRKEKVHTKGIARETMKDTTDSNRKPLIQEATVAGISPELLEIARRNAQTPLGKMGNVGGKIGGNHFHRRLH